MPIPDRIVLSHSGLSILDECPRCFWLKYRQRIERPEGFASRLPNRFDTVIKRSFDRYREVETLPPILAGRLRGRLQNPFQEKYRIDHNERFQFYGKLDECLILPDGLHVPVDHKTTSSDPRGKEPHPAYQKQLDAYAWLLEANGKGTAGFGILLFYYPDEAEAIEKGFPFVIWLVQLQTNPGEARKRFLRGVETLEGPLPPLNPSCSFCSYAETVTKITTDGRLAQW